MRDHRSVIARSSATKQSSWLPLLLSLPSRALSALIWIYQKTISPALVVAAPNCGCRFAPTCSHYAREALQEHGLVIGLALTIRRLVKCGPWHPGGLDPVPQKSRPICTAIRHGS